MVRLPVIAGFGGINPAGRLSFNNGYRRLVIDKLGEADKTRTYASLAGLMRLDDDPAAASTRAWIDEHTLIRRIENFDPERINWQRTARLKQAVEGGVQFVIDKRHMPEAVPASWQVETLSDRELRVTSHEPLDVLLPDTRSSRVTSAGQVPTGFDAGALYQSRNHPRGLQLTVYGASDALRSTGLSLETLKAAVPPDQIAVYSGSAMAQLDAEGYGGLLQNPWKGKRPTSKNAPLGLPEMAGDFVNAYVLGSVGETAGIIGACATFLYNVKRGMDEIRSGAKRIVVVGNSEAPVLPEVIEGYRVMGALAEDEELMELDSSTTVDNRRACRPFSSNCGFTVAEASVWTVLMDDELALQLGARVLGAVGDVFVNADGYKKSIPGPGIGNYLTVGKALAAARAILGEAALRQHTHIQAHGTGTPQNRVTESHILNEMAGQFGINNWLVGAVKAYVGHSMAPAGGDQLAAVLGAWEHGWVPGINTIDHIADDVHHEHLHLPFDHVEVDPASMQAALINSKGFGGNNATGLFLSPHVTMNMLAKRWGADALSSYRRKAEQVEEAALDYNARADSGEIAPLYRFGDGVLEGSDLDIDAHHIGVPGFGQPVSLDLPNPYPDMTSDDS